MKKFLSKLSAPLIWVGAFIAMLFFVVMDAILYGKRLQRRKEIRQDEKDQKKAVEKMVAAGDADALHNDIMERARGKKPR